MNTSQNLSTLIKRLLNELKYQELNELIGKKINITSAEEAPNEIMPILNEAISTDIQFKGPKEEYRRATVVKHGILDLVYDIPITMLQTNNLTETNLLKVLRLSDQSLINNEDSDGLSIYLEIFLDDLKEQESLLKVFLQTKVEWDWKQYRKNIREGIPDEYWPRTFIIEDACLTNVSSIWLERHLYG